MKGYVWDFGVLTTDGMRVGILVGYPDKAAAAAAIVKDFGIPVQIAYVNKLTFNYPVKQDESGAIYFELGQDGKVPTKE